MTSITSPSASARHRSVRAAGQHVPAGSTDRRLRVDPRHSIRALYRSAGDDRMRQWLAREGHADQAGVAARSHEHDRPGRVDDQDIEVSHPERGVRAKAQKRGVEQADQRALLAGWAGHRDRLDESRSLIEWVASHLTVDGLTG